MIAIEKFFHLRLNNLIKTRIAKEVVATPCNKM
jgi:hypothetical protein